MTEDKEVFTGGLSCTPVINIFMKEDCCKYNLLTGEGLTYLNIEKMVSSINSEYILIIQDDDFQNVHYKNLLTKLKEKLESYRPSYKIFLCTQRLEIIEAFSQLNKTYDSFNENDMKMYRIEIDEEQYFTVPYTMKNLRVSLEAGWEVR